MDCFKKVPLPEPLWASQLKGYKVDELLELEALLQHTLNWFTVKQIYNSVQDVVMFKVGIPYLGSDKEANTVKVYDGTFNSIKGIIRGIDLDVVKLTVPSSVSTSINYTYKSEFEHRRLSHYFKAGVTNNSGVVLQTPSLSAHVGIDNGYTIAGVVEPLPLKILHTFIFMSQNIGLFATVSNAASIDAKLKAYNEGRDTPENEKSGDIVIYNTQQFFGHMQTILARTSEQIAKLATPVQQEIHNILEYTNMGNAFKDIKYGGQLDNMRVVMRIPASRDNQHVLEGMLNVGVAGKPERFDDVFVEVWETIKEKDFENSYKHEVLREPYNTDKHNGHPGLYNFLDDRPAYGCKKGNRYRYWYVNAKWLEESTAENISVIFWLGLDVITKYAEKKCPWDKILAIIMVVVITYFSAGLGTAGAAMTLQGMAALAAAAISIASILGIIPPKIAKIFGLITAVFTLGANLMATFAQSVMKGLLAVLDLALKIAKVALETHMQSVAESFQKEMHALHDELHALQAQDAEAWENTVHYSHSKGVYESGPNKLKEHPLKFIHDSYSPFMTYKREGFLKS